jgi:predicted ArsR family transcriptional regulator
MPTSNAAATLAEASASLVRLLGDARARIVTRLRDGRCNVAQLAEHLGISEVAVRRHLTVLDEEGFVTSRTVREDRRGRPAAWYELTDDAQALFPHRYDRLASEMLDFLTAEHGRAGLRAFLRWRLEREAAELREAVTAEDLHEKLGQLAHALSDAGCAAEVQPTPDGFRLVQNHCTIADVAKEHPEVCAYEAAAFSKVLGDDVTLSRRDTLASGATACVCSVSETAKSHEESDDESGREPEKPTRESRRRTSDTPDGPANSDLEPTSPERAGDHQ